jgi:hypothetical protein
MRRTTAAVLGAILRATGFSALAQLAPLPTAPGGGAAPPTVGVSQRLALARRYMADIGYEASLRRQLDLQYPTMVQGVLRSHPEFSPEWKAMLAASMREALTDFLPKLRDEAAEAYAAAYTIDELQALAAFYESPVGHSITSKKINVDEIEYRLIQSLRPQLVADMVRRLCSRANCPPQTLSRIPGTP